MLKEILRKSNDLARSIYDDFKEFLSPSLCLGCRGDVGGESLFFCESCLVDLNSISGEGPLCPYCGRPDGVPGSCEYCSNPASMRLYFWGPYDGLLKDSILAFKFDGMIDLGKELAELATARLLSRLERQAVDMIVAVPLYKTHQRERGFNQSEIITGVLAEKLGAPENNNLLIRTRPTAQQAKLDVKHRWENVRGAFALSAEVNLENRRILLVDDVVTTGATIYEAGLPLISAGARVTAFSLAHSG